MRRLLLCASLLTTACGDDDSDGPPPPPEVTGTLADGTTLTVATGDPLTLTLTRGSDVVLEAPAFVEVGVENGTIDPDLYVDPAVIASSVRFRVATHATAYDAATRTLTLALDGAGGGRAKLTVGADGVLTLVTDGVPGAVLARLVLPLDADEDLYGFGMTADSPASHGVLREMQFRLDLGRESGINELHVPIPLMFSPARALGVFAEERRVGAFDVGLARPDATLVTYATTSLTVHFYGGDAFSVLDQYTSATGRPLVPPEWAFLPMQWRNSVADGSVVLEDANRLRTEHIPGSTVWIDNPWQTGYNTFDFETGRFPDPAGLVDDLAALGFHCLLWSTPYLGPDGTTAADYAEGASMGFLVTGQDGQTPYDWPWSNGPGALVDFTAPGAIEWWGERVHKVTDLGFAGFKLDYGEDTVADLGAVKGFVHLAGGTPETLHDLYAKGYHQAYLDALPPGDGFLLTRHGTWGEQTVNTCIWPGDLDNDFSRRDLDQNVGGLPAAISDGLSLSTSGYPFYGSDIGGYRNGTPTTESLVRWAEYAALGTVMQLGGSGDSHNPWDTNLYGPEALPIYKTYARLHTDLFPYIYSLAVAAGESGRPVTYPPGLVTAGLAYEDAFMTGEALFAAPVVVEGATSRTVTLPPGQWVDWWTGAMAGTGGDVVMVDAPLATLPLWRKVGEIVVLLVTPIDTALPATAPGVLTLLDPANRGLRVVVTPSGAAHFALYDDGTLDVNEDGQGVDLAFTAGSRHFDARFELDWANSPLAATPPTSVTTGGGGPMLSNVADLAAVAACAAPGCWTYDGAAGVLYVRTIAAAAGATSMFRAQ